MQSKAGAGPECEQEHRWMTALQEAPAEPRTRYHEHYN